MTCTKADIVDKISKVHGFSGSESKVLVDGFFEELRQILASGVSVKLSGFGNFTVKKKPARPGRNPRTGAPAVVSARRVVTFNAGLKMRRSLSVGA